MDDNADHSGSNFLSSSQGEDGAVAQGVCQAKRAQSPAPSCAAGRSRKKLPGTGEVGVTPQSAAPRARLGFVLL